MFRTLFWGGILYFLPNSCTCPGVSDCFVCCVNKACEVYIKKIMVRYHRSRSHKTILASKTNRIVDLWPTKQQNNLTYSIQRDSNGGFIQCRSICFYCINQSQHCRMGITNTTHYSWPSSGIYIVVSISNPERCYWHLGGGFAARAHVSKS